jgi:hypothetical protein
MVVSTGGAAAVTAVLRAVAPQAASVMRACQEAVEKISRTGDGRRALVAEGACILLVDSLRTQCECTNCTVQHPSSQTVCMLFQLSSQASYATVRYALELLLVQLAVQCKVNRFAGVFSLIIWITNLLYGMILQRC